MRVAVNYTKMSAVTNPYIYRLQRLDDAIDIFRAAAYVTMLYLCLGRWQVKECPENAWKHRSSLQLACII